jgi:TRAP-type C4-dicarboxylate transport system permease small subunit
MSSMADVEAAAGGDGKPPEDPDAPGIVRGLRAVDRAIAKIEEVVIGVTLFALIGLGVYKAVRINLIPPVPTWIGEVLSYSVFTIGLIGAALSAQSNRLFNIDQFSRIFSPRGKLVVRILIAVFTIVVCCALTRACVNLREILADETGHLIEPKWGVLVLPTGLMLIALHFLVRMVCDVIYLLMGRVPPELKKQMVPHP